MRWGRPPAVPDPSVRRASVGGASSNAAATRLGPSRLISTAWSSGASKLTVAAECTTTSEAASSRRPSSSRPRPSRPTSPATAVTRAAVSVSKRDPSSERSRSKQSLRRISRWSLRSAEARRPGRTRTTTSASGMLRSTRSTSAVPRKPVPPVTKKRLAARASRMPTRSVYHLVGPLVYQLVETGLRWEVVGRGTAISTASGGGPATAERILDAALDSFAQRGYEATSLDAVAAGLSIRKQTILYWFPTKEELLRAVIERSGRELTETLEGALRGAGEGWDRVASVVRSVFRLAARRPELLGLVREASRLGPPAATWMTEALEPLA